MKYNIVFMKFPSISPAFALFSNLCLKGRWYKEGSIHWICKENKNSTLKSWLRSSKLPSSVTTLFLMLEAKSDKHSSQSEVCIRIAFMFKATRTPEVFCFSFSPLPLLFPLLFCFYYSISSVLWLPLISMPSFEFIAALPLPIALSLFVLCSSVEAIPLLMEKKKI